MYKYYQTKRYKNTIQFLKEVISDDSKILDLGVANSFTEVMKKENYFVENTIA